MLTNRKKMFISYGISAILFALMHLSNNINLEFIFAFACLIFMLISANYSMIVYFDLEKSKK